MTTLVSNRLEGKALEVRFDWADDRYLETISLLDGDRRRPLLTAQVGPTESEWPLSPPFQQLHIESRATGPIALLVGMAGKSHWSASVECQDGAAGFAFDVACHVRQEPTWLGSTYLCEPEILIRSGSGGLVCEWDSGGVRVAAAPVGGPAATLESEQQRVTVRAADDTGAGLPRTCRWKYCLTLDSGELRSC